MALGLSSQPKAWWLFVPSESLMITLLIVLLVVGFCLYYLVRHPIKSIKFTFSFLGLIILGAIGVMGFGFGISYLATL